MQLIIYQSSLFWLNRYHARESDRAVASPFITRWLLKSVDSIGACCAVRAIIFKGILGKCADLVNCYFFLNKCSQFDGEELCHV